VEFDRPILLKAFLKLTETMISGSESFWILVHYQGPISMHCS